MSLFNKIFGNANEKYLKSIAPLVEKTNILEPETEKLSNQGLREKAGSLKKLVQKGGELDAILPNAFALVREAAKRTLDQRHFDVQVMGGIVLHQGKVAQMITGEGKTLAATMPVFLNGLTGKGVHVVTVNDYLSRRDAVWMGQIYHLLGLSVGCLTHDQAFLYDPKYLEPKHGKGLDREGDRAGKEEESESKSKEDENLEDRDAERDLLGSFKVEQTYLRPVLRKEAYAADVLYGTNNEFGFDYLRDNLVKHISQRVQRDFYFAVLDEVDSILIDEARTPLIISAPDTEAAKAYQDFALLVPRLQQETDYEIDEKLKTVTLSEAGIEKVENILGIDNIYDQKGIKYLHHLEEALRAQAINPADGKPLFAKDRDYVVRNGEVIIVDEFTGRLMPGRRWSGGLHQAIEAKERVSVKPESVTLATITFQNYFRMYEKLAGMTGTAQTSAEELDKVYGLDVISVPTNRPMVRKDLPDKVFKSEAGKFKAIIKEIKARHDQGQPVLVGTRSIEKNEYLGKLLGIEGLPHQILNAKHHEKEAQIIAQAGKLKAITVATNMAGRGVYIVLGGNPSDPGAAKKVKELGGLFVLGTERHEARRIDNQLRGRTGRQGDAGASQFFISLEDELMRIFGGDRIKSLMEKLNLPDDEPIEVSLISGAIEGAQKKIEGLHFDSRSHLLEYDDVANKHREVIYKKRKEILELPDKDLRERVLEMIQSHNFKKQEYLIKEEEVGKENMRKVERAVWLKTLDWFWMNHLDHMEYLRDSVKLRGYASMNPLVEYKSEGHKIFKDLISSIELNFLNVIFKMTVKPGQGFVGATSNQIEQGKTVASGAKKPGRNDPCPCGKINPNTGRPMKYKKCCSPKFG